MFGIICISICNTLGLIYFTKSRVANRPLFEPPRPCPLLNLELSFISRAEKNLLQELKKFAKVQCNRVCVAQPMKNRVLTFFFIFGGHHVHEQYFYMVASKKKKKGQHLITHPDKNRGSPIEVCPLK